MHPRELHRIADGAQERIITAARTLAERHQIEPALIEALSLFQRDRETQAAYRLRATAELLEALAERTAPAGDGEAEPPQEPEPKRTRR